MKKTFAMLTVIVLMMGCHSTSDQHSAINPLTVSPADLLHHNYVLIHFDGQAIEPKNMNPRIEFGETFYVSGAMCNDFSGQGSLTGNLLKVSNIESTQTICPDQIRNQLDLVINTMLTEGSTLTLQDKTLTLSNTQHQLIFTLQDWVY